jgi:hypothetical protein
LFAIVNAPKIVVAARLPYPRIIVLSYLGNPSLAVRVFVTIHAPKETAMPLIPVILWVGVPVILLGGGYMLVHVMH